jgi:uncharacterized iron-regulated membrane protein
MPTMRQAVAASADRRWRRVLVQLHLWVALALCAPLVLLGLTGSILVFEEELSQLVDPLPAIAKGAPRPLADLLEAARRAAPELPPAAITLPLAADEPAAVRMTQGRAPAPGPGGRQVLVDPVSLEVVTVREPGSGLLRQIRQFHTSAMIQGRTGREVIGWLGVGMLFLGTTGLVLWWPRRGQWRASFVVKRGARGVRLQRDLHGAVGIWTWAVFIAVTFSGVYLCFPQTIGGAVASVFAARDLRAQPAPLGERPQGGTPLDIDAAVALAREAFPDMRLRFVGLPARRDEPMRISFLSAARDGGPPASVFVDPWNRRVTEVRDPRTYTLAETVLAWQHDLHEARGLGPLWRALVCVSGLLPLLFVVTGIWMWLLKRRARRSAAGRRELALQAGE